ncbi:MAG: hypothetical protein P1V97_04170 [Planctomycetota bacterium]|nr:hypothetical protein [Planctomycetota bacterium]
MRPRSFLDFALGIIFGLVLAIPVRAQLRPSGQKEVLQELPAEELSQKIESSATSLSEPTKTLEARILYYFRDSILAETKSYSEKEAASINSFLSRWLENDRGPAKSLSFELKLKLRFPSDWTIDEIEQGRKFELTSDDKLVRGIAFTALQKNATKAQLLNDYMTSVKAKLSSSAFQILKGDSTVPKDWSGTSYTWLTRVKLGDHWLYQRRTVVFTSDTVIVLSLASWQKIFETWDPFFQHLSKDLAIQAFEKK